MHGVGGEGGWRRTAENWATGSVFQARLFAVGEIGENAQARPIAELPVGAEDLAFEPRPAKAGASKVRHYLGAADRQQGPYELQSAASFRRYARVPVELRRAERRFCKRIRNIARMLRILVPEFLAASGPNGLGQRLIKIAKE